MIGHDYLKRLGVVLIPASAPDFFLEDRPTAVLIRQVLGAIAQFEKATTVAKLEAARTKIELIVNLKTANTLGLTFPITLLGRADEPIE